MLRGVRYMLCRQRQPCFACCHDADAAPLDMRHARRFISQYAAMLPLRVYRR